MQIITILNFVKKFKSFIYTKAQWASGNDPVIEILVEPRSNSRPQCGQCFRRGPGYDRLPTRAPQKNLWVISHLAMARNWGTRECVVFVT